MNKPKCNKCQDSGRVTCQRCINGTRKGDTYMEQGGSTMGCRDCHGFRWVPCKCSQVGGVNYPKARLY